MEEKKNEFLEDNQDQEAKQELEHPSEKVHEETDSYEEIAEESAPNEEEHAETGESSAENDENTPDSVGKSEPEATEEGGLVDNPTSDDVTADDVKGEIIADANEEITEVVNEEPTKEVDEEITDEVNEAVDEEANEEPSHSTDEESNTVNLEVENEASKGINETKPLSGLFSKETKKNTNGDDKAKPKKKNPKKTLPFIIIAIVLLIIIWPKHNHSWSEWQTVNEATCTENGSSARTCSDCGETETKAINASGHTFGEWSVTTNPTCTEDGSSARTCSNCDATETKAINASGHTLGEWSVTTNPTCTENGIKQKSCSSCEYAETAQINATGHNMESATCTSPKTCKNNCGHTEGSALGHKNKDGYCSRCGEKLTIDINTVYIDNDECSIKVLSIDPYSSWGYTIKIQLENKSSDKTYMFSIGNTSVNGIMCSTIFATEVAPGKQAIKEITFSTSTLNKYGVVDFTDIEIAFRVYDTNDWSADDVVNETINIYPYGKENATKFVRESQPDDIILVDNSYITVTAIKTGYTSLGGYEISLYIVNKTTDTDISITTEDESINGVIIDPFFSTSVPAGKCKFITMSWSSSALSNNCIETCTDIEMTIRAYDSNNWIAEDFVNQTIHIYPYGEESAISYVRESQDTDIVLVDNDYATVTVVSHGFNSYGSYEIKLFIVNKTDDIKISVSTDEESINGFMMDPFYATSLIEGKCKFSTISWSSTALEKNEITEVEIIEFLLIISDYNDWSSDDFFNSVVEITP